ncbi:MAG: TRAP transporter small permease [Calditrichaeota bacterium]|nr:MAG: TRAP transporter small permease [Calditrichota bacterium]
MKMIALKKGLDTFLEALVTVSMAVLTIDVTWQVITRFVIKHPSNWSEELATNLMIWVGLLGAAVALHRKSHLGIDYFTNRFSERRRLVTELVVYALVTVFSVGVMGFGGLRLVSITFMLGQLTPALKIPMGYIYLAIPVSGFFMTIYAAEFFVEAWGKLRRTRSAEAAAVHLKTKSIHN